LSRRACGSGRRPGRGSNGRCVAVDVQSTDQADVAAAIAGQHQATLSGVGRAAGDIRAPNVWIPDSSTWLQRLRAADPGWVPAGAPAVARGPVVLAVPQLVAATLAAPGTDLTWAALLPKLTSNAGLHPGTVDPNRDAASASGLLALAGAAKAAGGDSQQTTIVALRTLAAGRSALRTDLLARFPRAADAGSLSSSLTAAPPSEQAVIAYNAGQPAVPLAALYVNPAPSALDYPFTVLPGASQDQAAAACAVADRLSGGLLDDTWAVGVWIFSTQLDGGNDWNQLVPVGPLSSQRQRLAGALPAIQPKPNGGTGLYNTVLAAYKNVQAGWDPGRVNSVLIMTDGKNEDAPGLTLDRLVDDLKKAADPKRPVEVIALGIGDQVSQAELERITSTTGGATFLAPDPSKIGEIFIQALGLRPGTNR
jgi:hypothetical protein